MNIDQKGGWRLAGELSAIGLTLVLSTAIGYFLGAWIGESLGSKTWGGFIGAILGIAAGFMQMFKTVKKYLEELDAQNKDKGT